MCDLKILGRIHLWVFASSLALSVSNRVHCYHLVSAFHFSAHHYAVSHVACRSTVVVYNAFRVSLGLLRLGQAESESLA